MCRYQVVGQLQGWVSNRANEFRDTVNRSTLPPDTKHMLHVVNRMGAWFLRADNAAQKVAVPGCRHQVRCRPPLPRPLPDFPPHPRIRPATLSGAESLSLLDLPRLWHYLQWLW